MKYVTIAALVLILFGFAGMVKTARADTVNCTAVSSQPPIFTFYCVVVLDGSSNPPPVIQLPPPPRFGPAAQVPQTPDELSVLVGGVSWGWNRTGVNGWVYSGPQDLFIIPQNSVADSPVGRLFQGQTVVTGVLTLWDCQPRTPC